MSALLLASLLAAASTDGPAPRGGASSVQRVDSDPLGFSEGARPVEIGRGFVSAGSCGGCHEREYAEWAGSGHRRAHSSPLYQAGLVDEPSPFCVHCHSPLPEQAREVVANLPAYAARDPRRTLPALPRGPEPLAAEGVTCAACHVRDGVILGTGDGLGAPHDVRQVAELGSVELCAGCHEFRMPTFHGEGWTLTDEPMQGTVSEWRAWGGAETCQGCHMPAGRHTFPGAHDRRFLADALEVSVEGDALVLASRGVGHHLPTGDLFRHLTVEVGGDDGFRVIDRIGRTFEDGPDPVSGVWRKRQVGDTSLRPGEPRRVALPPDATRWRVRYHYGAEHDEGRGLVPMDDLIAELASGDR